jgi:hypothetical protein
LEMIVLVIVRTFHMNMCLILNGCKEKEMTYC